MEIKDLQISDHIEEYDPGYIGFDISVFIPDGRIKKVVKNCYSCDWLKYCKGGDDEHLCKQFGDVWIDDKDITDCCYCMEDEEDKYAGWEPIKHSISLEQAKRITIKEE